MKPAFSLFDMDAFIRDAGAERVSEDASRKLDELLEDSAKQVLFRARILARHAGRKKIMRSDVILAARQMRGKAPAGYA